GVYGVIRSEVCSEVYVLKPSVCDSE
ncbi:hypothetical protein A2U01_0118511, partial [Trifolium medium]|nr:hypothetical protein [Trifolium medium]